jgi:leucine dehydrogenase
MENRTIVLQGLGSVGMDLGMLLFWAGARLIVSDIDMDRCAQFVQKTGARVVPIDQVLKIECDLFSPCALGGIINERSIPELRCKAVAGSANNQLLKDSDADLLSARGILYAPDFVINAGGLINVTEELSSAGYNPMTARNKVDRLYEQLLTIYDIAKQTRSSTQKAALSLGDYRIRYRLGKRVEPPCFHHAIIA